MSICACAGRQELIRVPFRLRRPGARSVQLAFFLSREDEAPQPEAGYRLPSCSDDHDPAIVSDLLSMESTPGGGWSLEVPLRPGWYKYAFLVDGSWVQDPAAAACPDGSGGHVSARTIRAPARTIRFPLPARVRNRRRPAGLRQAV